MRGKGGVLAAALLVLAFAGGLGLLLQERFAVGDVFPPYSTHRTDPLGTRAYYESLSEVPGISVQRWEQVRFKTEQRQGAALLVLGADVDALLNTDRTDTDDLDLFISGGGRVVITFLPTSFVAESLVNTNFARHARSNQPLPRKQREAENAPGAKLKWQSLFGRWRVDFDHMSLTNGSPTNALATAAATHLEPTLSWHSTLVFDHLGTNWTTLYERGGRPVVIEARRGRGSILLATDSYFVSNEALFRERHPRLLAALPGAAHELVFDETHNGLVSRPGIMTLLRRFGLGSTLAALLVTAALAMWRQASPLVPPAPTDPTTGSNVVTGRAAAVGLVQLVRRHVPSSRLAALCVEEWRRTFAARAGSRGAALWPQVKERIDQAGTRPDPVTLHRDISQLLKEKRWKP
jgi:hypothetical protein